MSSRYIKVKDAAIPVFFGGCNQDRSYTVYKEEAWANWYTIVKLYDDGYVECTYSEEYDTSCKCYAYIPHYTLYDEQFSCLVERVHYSHKDQYGPYVEIWEHLRKENPHCSRDDFHRYGGVNLNFFRSCQRSCFGESVVPYPIDYMTYEHDAYSDVDYNKNSLEDPNLIEDVEAMHVVKQDEVSHVEDANQTLAQPTYWEERLRQYQVEADERSKRNKLESEERIRQSEEKYRQQKMESEERIKQSRLEAEERVKKRKEEYDARVRLEKEEAEKRYSALVAYVKQGIKLVLETSKEIGKTSIVQEVVNTIDLTPEISKIPEKCVEIPTKKSTSREVTSEVKEEQQNCCYDSDLGGNVEEEIQPTSILEMFPIDMSPLKTMKFSKNLDMDEKANVEVPKEEENISYEFNSDFGQEDDDLSNELDLGGINDEIGEIHEGDKGCDYDSGGKVNEEIQQELIDKSPLKLIEFVTNPYIDKTIDIQVHEEEEDISYEFNSDLSLEDDEHSYIDYLGGINEEVVGAQEDEEDVFYDVSMHDEDILCHFDTGGTQEETARFYDDDDIFYDYDLESSHKEDASFDFDPGDSKEKQFQQKYMSEIFSATSPTPHKWPTPMIIVEFVSLYGRSSLKSTIWVISNLLQLYFNEGISGSTFLNFSIKLDSNLQLLIVSWQKDHENIVVNMETCFIFEEMLLNVLLYEMIT
ncbi:hypothetical protein M5689_017150 [Euphorbia peplus]|nr:hypothetical protein M5689_017150 [Euphorbia peplus]